MRSLSKLLSVIHRERVRIPHKLPEAPHALGHSSCRACFRSGCCLPEWLLKLGEQWFREPLPTSTAFPSYPVSIRHGAGGQMSVGKGVNGALTIHIISSFSLPGPRASLHPFPYLSPLSPTSWQEAHDLQLHQVLSSIYSVSPSACFLLYRNICNSPGNTTLPNPRRSTS